MINELINTQTKTITASTSRSQTSLARSKINNSAEISITSLPPEINCYIASFLGAKDRINLNQAFIDNGLERFVDYKSTQLAFAQEFLSDQIDLISANKHYQVDLSKFDTEEIIEESDNISNTYLSHVLYQSYKEEKRISSAIFTLVDAVDLPRLEHNDLFISVARCIDEKSFTELVTLLFPDLTDEKIKAEIIKRCALFQSQYTAQSIQRELEMAIDLITFIDMPKKYFGIPFNIAKKQQKLPNHILSKLIKIVLESVHLMPNSAIREFLQKLRKPTKRTEAYELITNLVGKKIPLYSLNSPYHVMLQDDLALRINGMDFYRILRRSCADTMLLAEIQRDILNNGTDGMIKDMLINVLRELANPTAREASSTSSTQEVRTNRYRARNCCVLL